MWGTWRGHTTTVVPEPDFRADGLKDKQTYHTLCGSRSGELTMSFLAPSEEGSLEENLFIFLFF